MTKGYGSAESRNGDRIYVEPSVVDIGGVYLDVPKQDLWLTEKQAKKLCKLIKAAIKAGLDNG